MKRSKAISITLPEPMLKKAENLAKRENRTMSEFFRETLRRYIEIRSGWEKFNAYGQAQAKKLGIKESDVDRLIHEARREEQNSKLQK